MIHVYDGPFHAELRAGAGKRLKNQKEGRERIGTTVTQTFPGTVRDVVRPETPAVG